MKRWIKFWMVLAVLMAFFVVGNVNAQGEDIHQNVTIICSAESQDVIDVLTGESYGGVWARGEDMVGNCYATIVNQVVSGLQEHGIMVSVVQNSPELDPQINSNAMMEMYTTLSADGAPLVDYRQFDTPQHLALSPILDAHMNSEIGLYVISDEEKIAAANMATGIILYNLGRCDLALPYFDDTTVFYTDEGEALNSPETYFYRGNCALLSGDYQAAIDFFGSAFPENVTYINPLLSFSLQTNLAWAYIQLGETEQAFTLMDSVVETTQEIIDTHTYTVEALSHRAQLYALGFRYDDAIADMDSAIELAPDDPELYVLRGNITLLIYEWDRVLADYNTAITIAPDYADAYFYRGILYYTRADYPSALDDLNHYLELAPDGEHAANATTYIQEIQHTQAALDG